jgi:hypothetical protein
MYALKVLNALKALEEYSGGRHESMNRRLTRKIREKREEAHESRQKKRHGHDANHRHIVGTRPGTSPRHATRAKSWPVTSTPGGVRSDRRGRFNGGGDVEFRWV